MEDAEESLAATADGVRRPDTARGPAGRRPPPPARSVGIRARAASLETAGKAWAPTQGRGARVAPSAASPAEDANPAPVARAAVATKRLNERPPGGRLIDGEAECRIAASPPDNEPNERGEQWLGAWPNGGSWQTRPGACCGGFAGEAWGVS